MGRPLNKRNFKSGAGNQLAVRAKIGSNAEGDGFIVKQTGSDRYIVTVGANTGTVYLVDKSNGSLAANEATITFQDAELNTKRVKKLLSHRAIFFDDTSAGWSFDPATGALWEAADVEDGFAPTVVITIDTQPSDSSVNEGEGASFSVSASSEPSTTLSYEWNTVDGEDLTPISNTGVYTGADTDTLTISDATGLDSTDFIVVISATGAETVYSDVVTLTVVPT
ncbi:MAG: hypothetical protein M0R77_02335 [Gammaproteobacteria bacterium]|nr:hypothetical protein [Gammaproteobacteria bacterium]